jgi:hypothetical protein
LRSSRFREHEEVNPLEGAINIVDAMLVFACGMMLSLIIHWNVDLPGIQNSANVSQGKEVSQTPEIRNNLTAAQNKSSKTYQRLGIVYEDSATGKLYMVTNQQ